MYTGQIVMFGLALLLTTVIVIKADDDEKPGVCPPERYFTPFSDIPHDKCTSDKECEGDKKCCPDNGYKFCKPPAEERSGECPPAPKPEIKNRQDFCSSDSECAAGPKCCFGSNGKTCLPCDKVKAGNCEQTEVFQCFIVTSSARSLCEVKEKYPHSTLFSWMSNHKIMS
ncbi:WAP four-disulfide core domain 3-like [Pelobates cultripes]|uniref:WAP four-disulfide core domain 3-like n=1 Tax=Pelobates cultripes TaxID=61616 RepID=A0AAD1S5Z4_PELCU|nr:WAP four-disulfide core domain 3-like [Pelobates cultripes]